VLRHERWNHILAALEQGRAQAVSELADHFDVSPMTVRRDLDALEARGLVTRVHGGVVAAGVADPPASVRASRNQAAKLAAAERAVALLDDVRSVALGGGTTVAAVAERLRHRELSVVTDSLLVVDAFADDPLVSVHLVGGSIRAQTRTVTGPTVAEQLRSFRVDAAVVGASAIADGAFFNYHPEDAPAQLAMLEIAASSYLVADASKLTARAFGLVAPLSRLTAVVLDRPDLEVPSREAVEAAER
jgi:DeoR/GlpR family transcriptional regulator of sugar metabolism